VHELEGKVTAYEVKSGTFDRLLGLEAFSRKYPKARTVIIDWKSAEDWLLKQ